MKRGEVYTGKKAERGVVGSTDPVLPGVLNINATSGSVNKINGIPAKQFSPMYLGPVIEKDIFGKGDQTALIFEDYWQYSKIFRELGHIDEQGRITQIWYNFRAKGYAKTKGDRHPEGTKSNEVKYIDNRGNRHFRYYTAISSMYLDNVLDYVTSRKYIYAPVYGWLVVRTQAFHELRRQVDAGQNVQILDYDVLPGSNRITVEFLRDRINDPKVSFGHGYVLAGLLAGIEPSEYCYN
ncbi:Hypothetical protein HVR_LOCUS694 [uncultured virus]|nr:Hypothetical protein HVR_LOCUS694 [uncultured virus]